MFHSIRVTQKNAYTETLNLWMCVDISTDKKEKEFNNHVLCVMCHVSCVTYHLSSVTCHLSHATIANARDPPLLTSPLCTVGRFKKTTKNPVLKILHMGDTNSLDRCR